MLSRILKGLVRSYAQSDDHAIDPAVKTRYFRVMKDVAWGEIIQVMKSLNGYKFCFEITKSGELVYEKKTTTGRIMDITLTVIKTGPAETAIDIYSASRGSFGDLGSNYRVIKQVYQELDRHFANRK